MSLDTTNFTQLYSDVEKLSLFDLKQLQLAINNLLDDPERNLAVKRLLKSGMSVNKAGQERAHFWQARINGVRL